MATEIELKRAREELDKLKLRILAIEGVHYASPQSHDDNEEILDYEIVIGSTVGIIDGVLHDYNILNSRMASMLIALISDAMVSKALLSMRDNARVALGMDDDGGEKDDRQRRRQRANMSAENPNCRLCKRQLSCQK